MNVQASNYTVADFCQMLLSGEVVANKDYQRSEKVWPETAKSYLIDTILLGFPIPKLLWHQVLDLKTRKVNKEIVDGQQRSRAILDFFNDKLVLSRGSFKGMKFSSLDDEDKAKFLNYSLSVDIFTGANEIQIREVFKRINSYTIPLNGQEKRHAERQGEFKWFVLELTQTFSQGLKDLGVLSERQITRMDDAELFSEIIHSILYGINRITDSKLDSLYKEFDGEFPMRADLHRRFEATFSKIFDLPDLKNTPLMKRYNFYSLFQAITHCLSPVEKFQEDYSLSSPVAFSEISLENLLFLADLQSDERNNKNEDFKDFLRACSQGTNNSNSRKTRFDFYCRALCSRRRFVK